MFKSDPGGTVSSRFHRSNPGMNSTTTCVPVLTPTMDGVLPTYRPSRVISAPAGVEVKLHFTVSRVASGAGAEEPTADAAGELAAEPAVPELLAGSMTGAFCCVLDATGTLLLAAAMTVYVCFTSLPFEF